ncbi:MAG: hypothetical protein ACTSYM_02505 [Candidatus Baldrarchaeia archaeon]
MMEDFSAVEDVWERIKNQVSVSKEEFLNKVRELSKKLSWKANLRALALIVAKNLGADISPILVEPKRGRILEVGPIRVSSSRGQETPYCIFVLVNEDERLWSVAFGEENVEKVRSLEDKPVEILNYTLTSVRGRRLLRVTENSKIIELSEDVLPPLPDLKPAQAASLKEVLEGKGSYVVSFIVVEEDMVEYPSCPVCKRSVDMVESEWVCPTHGSVEPEMRKVYHYYIADDSGTYSAVFFGEPPRERITGTKVTAKGYFKGEEFQISKIYRIEDLVSTV